MRIISSFRDYYDSAAGQMFDESILYKRESKVLTLTGALRDAVLNSIADPSMMGVYHDKYPMTPWPVMLGFCGRAWLAYSELDTFEGPEPRLVTLPSALKAVQDRVKKSPRDGDLSWQLELLENCELFVRPRGDSWTLPPWVFREGEGVGAPAFLVRRESWEGKYRVQCVTNPLLKGSPVANLYDPWSAYQEIAMYLSGPMVLFDEGPATTGDDRTVAQAKGFDDQSFRQAAPGKKKVQRQANRLRKRGIEPTEPSE